MLRIEDATMLHTVLNRIGRAFLLLILLSILYAPVISADISQTPLFLTGGVDPNIMFIIDDSGSMMWETMPDDLTYFFGSSSAQRLHWVFPPISNLHGNEYSGVSWRIPFFRLDNNGNISDFAARVRSSHNNPVYYDPAVTYRPWVNSDGSEMLPSPPTDAPNRPLFDGTVTGNTDFGRVDLTNDMTYALWRRDDGGTSNASLDFYPAVYYFYNGGGVASASNYTYVEIKEENAPFFGHGRENRSDCENASEATPSCTYDEEIQNFANWYTYHRSRIFTARGGIGRAFVDLGENVRVGYASINYRRTSTGTLDGMTGQRSVIRGVRPFTGADRNSFYDELYMRPIPADGTPLRRALDGVGQYFSQSDVRGPWSCTPGVDTPGESSADHLPCRQSFAILMTDGFATGGSGWDAAHNNRKANTDGSTAQNTTNEHPSDSNLDFEYEPKDPYQDEFADTLADVAMYYWKRDLRSDLPNRVPVTSRNPAFWQHMVTFGVGLGVEGAISYADALAAVADGTEIEWPDPNYSTVNCGEVAGACSARIDDLLHASINGRGGFFSTSDPDVFARELSETLKSILDETESSAAAVATNTTRLVDGSLIYQARFDSRDWSGEIRAYPIQVDGSVIYTPEQWASYYQSRYPLLPIPPFPGWSTNDANKIPSHSVRKIFTWNGTLGIPFTEAQWDNLSTAQQDALVGSDDEPVGKQRLNWLRGEHVAGMRSRSAVLGDIVNSDPLIVGVPNFRYELLPTTAPGQSTYQTFRADNFNRKRVLYVGANDGMLHAFDANRIDLSNTDGGTELFAFMPASVFDHIAELTDPEYSHRYYVDGSPIVGDAYVNLYGDGAEWRTILIGTYGAGGRGVFALDVTDPDTFNQANVLWEFTDPDLGYTFGQPTLVRMANGKWAVVFGNGYGSDNHKAMLFIVDVESGTLIKKIDTGVGTSMSKNGLSTPALLANSNRTIITAYAGDLLGNLWKFDLSHASNTGQWDVAFSGGGSKLPLFTARNVAGQVQPITAPLEIGVPPSGQSGYMVYFGTGKYYENADNDVSNPATNPGIQSFYGIWDNGNRIAITDRGNVNFPLVSQEILDEVTVTVEDGEIVDVATITAGDLQINQTSYRVVSENAVNYPAKRGWYMDLVSPEFNEQGERVVSAPLLRRGQVIFTTLIPDNDPCSFGGTSWLMILNATTGVLSQKPVFDVTGDGTVDSSAYGGRQSKVGIVKTPAVIQSPTGDHMYFGGQGGNVEKVTTTPGDEDEFGRRSWRQLQ